MPRQLPSTARLTRSIKKFQAKAPRSPRWRSVRIRVTEEEHAAFRACAERFGTSISSLIRQLVEHARITH